MLVTTPVQHRTRSMRPIVIVLLVVVTGILGACSRQTAVSQESTFPTRSITYLIPFDPGGPSDIVAQQQIPGLKEALGQDIALDYKVGEGGGLAWAEVARSNPDGYTIVAVNSPHIVVQPMYGNVQYKTDQFDVIAFFASTPCGLAVLKNSPYNTLEDFLAAAKANPGKFKLGITSQLGSQHLAALLFQKMTDTTFELVVYTGASSQLTSFIGGEVDAVIANTSDFVKYKDDVRVLGLATDTRYPDLLDVPTFKEQGLDLKVSTDRGVAVPAGTPTDVVKKLESAFLEVVNDSEFQTEMTKQGYAKMVLGRDEAKAYIAQLSEMYKQLADSFK